MAHKMRNSPLKKGLLFALSPLWERVGRGVFQRAVKGCFIALLLPALWAGEVPPPGTPNGARSGSARPEATTNPSATGHGVVRDPGSPRSWSVLAEDHFRNGDFEAAEQAARQALRMEPNEVDAKVVLARCLETQGDLSGAGQQLTEAVALAPDHPTALRLMAGKVDLNTEREKALQLTRHYVELKPPDQGLFVEHARLMLGLMSLVGPLELSKRPPWDEQPERVEWPLRIDTQNVSIELQVGSEKRRFIMDTGEESITVRAETAKAFGCKPLAELPAVTATGMGRLPILLAPRLEAGAFRVENVLVTLGATDAVGPSFFSGYAVRLDFDRRLMTLTRQPQDTAPGPKDLFGAPEGFARYRFRRLGNLIWVPISCPKAPAALKARPAWGVLDTGCQYPAAVTMRYLDALRSERGRGPLALPFRGELGGAADERGKQVVFYALKDFDLEFLGARLSADGSAATASFGEISKVAEAEMDLLIGWSLIHRSFKSLEIDYQRCVLTVEPRAVPLPR